jgi:hypothetical protein
MAWYDNTRVAAILGGLVGAIVTADVSVLSWQKTNKIRRVAHLGERMFRR